MEWQVEKSFLNHGWLQNTILRDLRGLHDEMPLPEYLYLLDEIFDEWRAHRSQIGELIHKYASSESPKTLVSEVCLFKGNGEERKWLEGLVHACWLNRTDAKGNTKEALEALERCNSCYEKLDEAFVLRSKALDEAQSSDVGNTQIGQSESSELSRLVREFIESVGNLSEKLNHFPFNARLR